MHANLTNSFLADRIGRGEDLRTAQRIKGSVRDSKCSCKSMG